MTKKKQKELERKQEVATPASEPPPPDQPNINFDDVYSFLNEAMNKIETSSDKTKRRIQSSKGSSGKFVKPAPGGTSRSGIQKTIEEKPEPDHQGKAEAAIEEAEQMADDAD